MHRDQVRLQAEGRRPLGVHTQQVPARPGLEVDADGPHVPRDLGRRLLEGEVQTALSPLARGFREVRRHTGFAGARRSGHEHAVAAKESLLPKHRVQPGHPGGQVRARRLVRESQRRDRQHGDPVVVDEERHFVAAVRRAAVLEDAQPPSGALLHHPLVEQDHAVRDVLLETVARQVLAIPLARHDGRDSLRL